jgi:hypothetical protein
MKLTKDQVKYDIYDGEVSIWHIWTHRVLDRSIRVLEYPSHIERRRVISINFTDDILFFEVRKQLKKIIVPFDCSLSGEYKLPDYVTIEYK